MPTIPTYQPGAAPDTVRGITPHASGYDPIAAGLGSVSQGIGQMAADLDRQQRIEKAAKQKQDDERARVWAGEQAGASMLAEQDALHKAQDSAPAGADGFAKSYLEDLDKRQAAVMVNAPDEASKRFLQQHLIAQRTHFGTSAQAFQFKAADDDIVTRFSNSADTWSRVVQQDPSTYTAAMQVLSQTMPDVRPEVRDKLTEHARKTMSNAVAANLLENDPYMLQDATSKALGFKGYTGPVGATWIDTAKPEQVTVWNNQAETKVRQIEAQMARDSQARDKEAEQLFGAATDLSYKGQYLDSPTQARLLAASKGTRYESAAQELIDGQKLTAGFASAPADHRTAALNAMRSRGSDPAVGTSPEMHKELEKFERIDAAVKTEVDKNPWVAGQSYGVLKSAPAMLVTNGDDAIKAINARAGVQTALETWAGKPVSPLQPAEAAQLSDSLAAMNPQARGVELAKIGRALPLQRLEALADQLDAKDKAQALALKFTDNTSAGRPLSDLILRGDQSIKDKSIKKDDSALSGWRASIAGMVRGTMGPQGEKAENDIINAAYFVRAAMENSGNAVPGFDMRANEKEAVKFVIGEPLERNGTKTFLPRSMTESQFDTALQKYTPDTLKSLAPDGALYLRGQPITLDRFSGSITRYGMTRDGKGNFIPGSGGSFITTDKAGTIPLRLPVSAAMLR